MKFENNKFVMNDVSSALISFHEEFNQDKAKYHQPQLSFLSFYVCALFFL